LGREFSADELQSEKINELLTGESEEWRIVRARNKWHSAEESAAHPFPGTFPVIVTGDADWGGWRVPGAEYALSPTRVEKQARIIVSAPHMMDIIKRLVEWAEHTPKAVPEALTEPARRARDLLSYLEDDAE
jgi:hypothetical protein